MYALEFKAGDEVSETRYSTCYVAIAITQKQVAVAEWDDVIALMKKLKAVGRDSKEKVQGASLYILGEEGGTVHLERSEHRMLVDFVKQPIWRPTGLEEARNVLKWLEGLKPEEEAKPTPKETTDGQS